MRVAFLDCRHFYAAVLLDAVIARRIRRRVVLDELADRAILLGRYILRDRVFGGRRFFGDCVNARFLAEGFACHVPVRAIHGRVLSCGKEGA
jgi:hypothetical protein